MIIIDAPILKTGLCYGLGVGPVPFVAMSSLFPQVKLLNKPFNNCFYTEIGINAKQKVFL